MEAARLVEEDGHEFNTSMGCKAEGKCTEDCIMVVHPLSLTISTEPSHAPTGCLH